MVRFFLQPQSLLDVERQAPTVREVDHSNTEVLHGQDGRAVAGDVAEDSQDSVPQFPLVRQADVEPL
jgi:hypothetical protein